MFILKALSEFSILESEANSSKNCFTPCLRHSSNPMGMPHDAARAFAVIQTDSHEFCKYHCSDKLMDKSLEAALESTLFDCSSFDAELVHNKILSQKTRFMIMSIFAMFFLMPTASSRSFLSLLVNKMTDSHFKMSTNLSRTPRTESTLDDHLLMQSFLKDKDESTASNCKPLDRFMDDAKYT